MGSFEIRRTRSRGWINFGRRWTRGMGGYENWTIFMDVICVSSLTKKRHSFLCHLTGAIGNKGHCFANATHNKFLMGSIWTFNF